MINIEDELQKLLEMARNDRELRERLLATRTSDKPISDFCDIALSVGCRIDVIGLIDLGESAYAAMKRSTNGGGENSPLLDGQDDEYALFLANLEGME